MSMIPPVAEANTSTCRTYTFGPARGRGTWDVSSPVRNFEIPSESYPTKFDAYLEGTACLPEDGDIAQDRHGS
jgi:hypothetical protein